MELWKNFMLTMWRYQDANIENPQLVFTEGNIQNAIRQSNRKVDAKQAGNRAQFKHLHWSNQQSNSRTRYLIYYQSRREGRAFNKLL